MTKITNPVKYYGFTKDEWKFIHDVNPHRKPQNKKEKQDIQREARDVLYLAQFAK